MSDPLWWRRAVIYQVYIRSFADGDGDGLGDIAGIRSRLDYLAGLGVDAVWINPWYPSPMADAGYDVSDYRDVEPRFGTLAGAEALIAEAHEHGLRVLLDIVPNHSSDAHPWFTAALAAAPGSLARQHYVFRDGRGADGAEPPNDWGSVFGDSAWTRVGDGQWYLHLFAPQQPDLNWEHPDVRADFERTLRFWFDRGVDGFRIDVAHSLIKQAGLPDLGGRTYPREAVERDGAIHRTPWQAHPHWDRDEVHQVYREWRALADTYDPPRIFVAEAWVDEPERMVRYVRPDELHTAFNFAYLTSPWRAKHLRTTIEETLAEHTGVGAPATWVLSNHDVMRHASRYAQIVQPTTPVRHASDVHGPTYVELGRRRARAAALLTLALPGSAYVYQGEELGLADVEDLPDSVLQDPIWERSNHTERGRDGCRVPIPWTVEGSSHGFSPPGSSAAPWLPQPAGWGELSVQAQDGVPTSTLELYRAALRIRREHPALGDGAMTWLDLPDGALGFRREPGFACLVNISAASVPLPADSRVLLASGPLAADGALPADTGVWVAI